MEGSWNEVQREKAIGKLHEELRDIQNGFWKAYKEYASSGDMRKYNKDLKAILERHRTDMEMLEFCQNLAVTWTPVICRVQRLLRDSENILMF